MSKGQNTTGIGRRRFRPYPQYKDSGVKWLGKIPAHWDITRIKEQFCIVSGSTPSSSDPSFWDGDVVWVTPDDLGELHVSRLGDSSRKITEEGYKSCGTSIVPKGSIVVSTRAPIGYVAIATTNLCTNQGCKSLVPKKPLSTGFFYYQLGSAKNELESRGEGSTFKEISKDKLGQIILAKPSEPEQHAIAAFLDRETAKIDALIEKKERLIELLQEKRTALITQAVTKGLNPSVPMKDSEIEWIESIPGSWRVCPLFTIAREKEKRNIGNQVQNVLSLSYGKIIDKDVSDNFGLLPESFETYQIVSKGNIILRLTDLQNDKRSLRVGLVNHQGIITSAYICLDLIREIDASYAFYLLHAYDIIKVFYSFGGGVRQTMKFEDLKWLPILMPPFEEQHAIAALLDRETAKIDALMSKIREAIAYLREYRTALISAAVTGKIDVREA